MCPYMCINACVCTVHTRVPVCTCTACVYIGVCVHVSVRLQMKRRWECDPRLTSSLQEAPSALLMPFQTSVKPLRGSSSLWRVEESGGARFVSGVG